MPDQCQASSAPKNSADWSFEPQEQDLTDDTINGDLLAVFVFGT